MTIDRNQVLDIPDSSYVLPQPPVGKGEALGFEDIGGAATTTATAPIARAFGERLVVQADSLKLFLTEVRTQLTQLDAAIAEDSRAQLKGAVRELSNVVSWCDAVQSELRFEGLNALAGKEPIDLEEHCRAVVGSVQTATDPISVTATGRVVWWGHRAAFSHALQRALELVRARTGEVGLRCVQVEAEAGVPSVRVWSRGEPVESIDGDIVDRFRAAADHVGAAVIPDKIGPGGAGLVLKLPVA